MGTEWLVTIWRWKIYVFSNWWLVSAAAGGLRDIPGHWGHLIWSDDGIVCGWPLVRAGHEEIIYPRFIVKLLTALERLGPHRPATWAGHGTSRVKCDFWAGIFLFLQSRSHVPCVPCVLRTIVSRVSHEARGQKHTLESGAGALWQGRSLSNEQPEGWGGSALSTCHNLNSNLAMKSLKWIRVIFNSYQQSCHLPLSN